MKMERQFWFLESYEKRNENESYIDFKRNRELQYDINQKKWVTRIKYTDSMYPGVFPCRSYRAARRHLKKHDEIPKGTRFRLVNTFVGCDRLLYKK